jgi:class 3 adenylate cyclase/tetratricopeptide (TPR) repeat protein
MQCPRCNTKWPDEMAGMLKFCGACGAPLTSASTLTWQPPTMDKAGGELRFVTIVFADITGFTSFAEDRPPDEVARIVGDLLQRLTTAVEKYNGTVYQYLGDAVVATFGLPRPDPNASRNAVRAGLDMQVTTRQFSSEYKLTFQLRVGIHAGEVMHHTIGGSWAIMGDTVNTANRIQTATAPGAVWISRSVYDEVRRYFTFDVRPAVELKGKKQAVQPYEVIAERTIPFLNLPLFVGREKEWNQLQVTLQEAVAQKGLRVVLIRGAAGVGKSRLTWELRDWVQRQEQFYRLDVVQYDHSETLPSHGLNSLIRNRFSLPLLMSEEEVVKRLNEQMRQENPAIDPGREELTAEFFSFVLGVSRPGFHIQSMDGKSKLDGAFVEIKNWMEGCAAASPWVWILEDAQKGDADTAAFLEWAIHLKWNAPMLVIITVREEDFSPAGYWYEPLKKWSQDGLVDEIRLSEIPPAVLASALVTMLDGEVSQTVALRIAEHTEGNPLFAIELVLYLKEQNLLNNEAIWEKATLPNSVREVMEARIERLGNDGKEVAKRGALMGRRFTAEGVERIWDRPGHEMENGLVVLRETETIYEEASKLFIGEVEQVFRHGRLQDAALARIPREERLRWLVELEHWAQAKLEELGDRWEGGGILLIPLIARSREENGDGWQASLWYEVVGLLHRKYHRTQEAAQAFHKALASASGIRRLTLCRQCAEVELFAGEAEKALKTINEVGQIAGAPAGELTESLRQKLASLTEDSLMRLETLDLPTAEMMLELTRADAFVHLARVSEADAVYKALGVRLETLTGENSLRLWLRWGRAWSYFLSQIVGNAKAAEEVCNSIRQRIDLQNPALEEERMFFLNGESIVEMDMGRYDDAQVHNDERLMIAEKRKNLKEQTAAWNVKGIIAQSLGDLNATCEDYEKALTISRAIGYRRGEVVTLHNLGSTYADMGRWDIAIQHEEQYLAISRVTGNRLAEAYAPFTLGSIAIEQGEFERADALLRQGLKIAEENGWPLLTEIGQLSLVNLRFYRWFEQCDPAELQEVVRQMKTFEQSPHTDQKGEFFATLSVAALLSGDPEEARAILQRARQKEDDSWVTDRVWLDYAEAVINNQSCKTSLDWFRQRGFMRAVAFAERVQRVLGEVGK